MRLRAAAGILPAVLLSVFAGLSGAVPGARPDPSTLGASLAATLLFFQTIGVPTGSALLPRLGKAAAALALSSILALLDRLVPTGAMTGLSIAFAVLFLVHARSLSLVDDPRGAGATIMALVAMLLLDGILLALLPGTDDPAGRGRGLVLAGIDPVAAVAFILASVAGFRSGWVTHLGSRQRRFALAVSAALSALSAAAASEVSAAGASAAMAGFSATLSATCSAMAGAASLALLISIPTAGAIDRLRRELASMRRIGELILSGAGKETVCEVAADLALRLPGVDACWIELVDESGSSSIVRVSGTDLIEPGLPGCGIGDWAREEGAPSQGGARILPNLPPGTPLSRLSSAGLGIRSLIVAPIRAGGVELGSLVAASSSPFVFVRNSADLLEAFAGQVGLALLNSRLLGESIQKARYQEELSIARSIQEGLLSVTLPDMPPFRSAVYSRPSMEVGGDCFDISTIPGGRVGLFMADVAGKGAGAAILMSAVHASAMTLLGEGYPPSRIASAINTLLCRISPEDRFVTFFCAVLDPSSGLLEYTNAGHDPPVLAGCGCSGRTLELDRGGLVLGISGSARFESAAVEILSGETLVLYTDGLTDGIGRFDEQPRRWIADVVRDHPGDPPARIVERLVSGSEAPEPDIPADDVTVLVICRGY